MRVITGKARGRNLLAVEGLTTRPTLAQTKQSIFNAIQFDIEGRRVLDLFAGTGQMGIEALSRGAEHCVFVDSYGAAIRVIRENLKHTGLEAQSEVVQTDYVNALSRFTPGQFGLIFLDPPYEQGILQDALRRIAERELLAVGGLIVCEGQKGEPMPEGAPGLSLYRTYLYGRTAVTLYVRRSEEAL